MNPVFEQGERVKPGELDELAALCRSTNRAILIRTYDDRNAATTVAHRTGRFDVPKLATTLGRNLKAMTRVVDGHAGVFLYLTERQVELVDKGEFVSGRDIRRHRAGDRG